MSEPAAKKAKVVEEDDGVDVKEVPLPEPMQVDEIEKDTLAKNDRTKFDKTVMFNPCDTTMNVMVCASGTLLRPLTEGCFQHLLAGARASVGVKSGRYMFEAKLVENLGVSDEYGHGKKGLGTKHVVRIGFSTASSSLFLDDAESFYFDSDGFFVHESQRWEVGRRFGRDCVLALVLNLDSSSPICNTVSLFVDGERASAPQSLPEHLRALPLFPTVTFQNATIHVNFSSQTLAPLPFTCRTVEGADEADVVASPTPQKNKKCQVLFPVGLPDEGAFEWLDLFLQKNPTYTELSGRSMLKWAEQSGLQRPFTGFGKRGSRDQPTMHFGIPALDDHSFAHLIGAVARVQHRDYVVMQMGSNFLKEDRAKSLLHFPSKYYERIGQIVMGEPSTELVEYSHMQMLTQKEEAFKVAQAEAKRQREKEKMRLKADNMRKKLVEEKKRKLEQGQSDGQDISADEKAKQEEKQDSEAGEKEDEAADEEKEVEEDAPKIELSDAEKSLKFPKLDVPDLTSSNLSRLIGRFSIPGKDEGFDDIRYAWSNEKESAEYFKGWINERRHNIRLENIIPSTWFHEKYASWQKTLSEWINNLQSYKTARASKEARRLEKSKRKPGSARVEKDDAEEDSEAENSDEIDIEGIDIFSLEDICDIGSGVPLFSEFLPEDWAMANLRFELYILNHAFRRDSGEFDRKGIHLDHLVFYFQTYFKKTLLPKAYGVDSVDSIVGLVADAVNVNGCRVIETLIPDELERFDVFVKVTEEARRARILTVETGNNSARLRLQHYILSPYQRKPQPKPQPKLQAQSWDKPAGNGGIVLGGKAKGKSGGKGGGYVSNASSSDHDGGKARGGIQLGKPDAGGPKIILPKKNKWKQWK